MRTTSAPLLVILLLLILTYAAVSNKFDSDTGENCDQKAAKELCTTTPDTYFECPITCARRVRPERAAWGGFDSSDSPFYQFRWRDYQGKRVNFEDFDGEIVIVATIPMLPGLAQYNYDLLNHVLDVYKYGVEVVVVPMKGQDGIAIEPKEGSRIRILEGLENDANHKVVSYLAKFIQKGKFDGKLLNAFIVGPLGNRITLHISPDMLTYRKYVDIELNEMDTEL